MTRHGHADSLAVSLAQKAHKLAADRAAPPRQDEPDLPLFEFRHRFENNVEMLGDIEQPWKRLVATAIEPNSFFEPWFFLPAWRQLAQQEQVELLIVEAPKRVHPDGPKVICAIIPIIRRRTFYGLPVRTWEVWRHPHCYLGTPLVRRDCVREVLDYLFTAAATSPDGAAVIHFPMISGDGPFHRALVDSNYAARRSVFTKDLQTRAMFRKAEDAEAFLKASLSRKKRQSVQRTERRLAELGTLTTTWYRDHDNVDSLTDEFLRLEAAGWKGQTQTALDSNQRDAKFFREMLHTGAMAGKLLLGRLDFDGRPIAMICNFLAADGGYSFKITYDEKFAEHSPGLLLELALIRELHERGTEWMDSCAVPDHPMINPLWPERTIRTSLVVSSGARFGDLATALMPLVRWMKNKLSRGKYREAAGGREAASGRAAHAKTNHTHD
jgi:CelD/BcsL family acetyltransferase involved in cellulose biosynthesis